MVTSNNLKYHILFYKKESNLLTYSSDLVLYKPETPYDIILGPLQQRNEDKRFIDVMNVYYYGFLPE